MLSTGLKTWIAIVVVAALALLPLLPGAIDSYAFSFLFFVFIYAIMAQGWNLVAGFGGQISLGNHAFFGLGAYTTAILWSGNYLWGSLYDAYPAHLLFRSGDDGCWAGWSRRSPPSSSACRCCRNCAATISRWARSASARSSR